MSESSSSSSSGSSSSGSKTKQKAETTDWEKAQEQGYLGATNDQIPNEDYAVDADHEATAKAQREQLVSVKADQLTASSEGSS